MKVSLLRSLLDRCGRDQDLVIRQTGSDGLQVQIANKIVLSGERDVVIRLLEDGYHREEPNPNQLSINWLDCEDCRALSKSGARPSRCDLHRAVERGVD